MSMSPSPVASLPIQAPVQAVPPWMMNMAAQNPGIAQMTPEGQLLAHYAAALGAQAPVPTQPLTPAQVLAPYGVSQSALNPAQNLTFSGSRLASPQSRLGTILQNALIGASVGPSRTPAAAISNIAQMMLQRPEIRQQMALQHAMAQPTAVNQLAGQQATELLNRARAAYYAQYPELQRTLASASAKEQGDLGKTQLGYAKTIGDLQAKLTKMQNDLKLGMAKIGAQHQANQAKNAKQYNTPIIKDTKRGLLVYQNPDGSHRVVQYAPGQESNQSQRPARISADQKAMQTISDDALRQYGEIENSITKSFKGPVNLKNLTDDQKQMLTQAQIQKQNVYNEYRNRMKQHGVDPGPRDFPLQPWIQGWEPESGHAGGGSPASRSAGAQPAPGPRNVPAPPQGAANAWNPQAYGAVPLQ